MKMSNLVLWEYIDTTDLQKLYKELAQTFSVSHTLHYYSTTGTVLKNSYYFKYTKERLYSMKMIFWL